MQNISDLTTYVNQALVIAYKLSMPSILMAALVGTLVSIIQALTQIQEQTLAFAIKLLALGITILVTMGIMTNDIYHYTVQGFNLLATVGK